MNVQAEEIENLSFGHTMGPLTNGFYVSRKAWSKTRYAYLDKQRRLKIVYYNVTHPKQEITEEDLSANDWYVVPVQYDAEKGERYVFRNNGGINNLEDESVSTVVFTNDAAKIISASKKSDEEIRGIGRQVLTQMNECDIELLIGRRIVKTANNIVKSENGGYPWKANIIARINFVISSESENNPDIRDMPS